MDMKIDSRSSRPVYEQIKQEIILQILSGTLPEGEQLTPDRIHEMSKWPSRPEQLSIVSGQILSPGARLASQLIGPGGAVASQIEKKAEEQA